MLRVESLDTPLIRPILIRYFSFGTLMNMKDKSFLHFLPFLPFFTLRKSCLRCLRAYIPLHIKRGPSSQQILLRSSKENLEQQRDFERLHSRICSEWTNNSPFSPLHANAAVVLLCSLHSRPDVLHIADSSCRASSETNRLKKFPCCCPALQPLLNVTGERHDFKMRSIAAASLCDIANVLIGKSLRVRTARSPSEQNLKAMTH